MVSVSLADGYCSWQHYAGALQQHVLQQGLAYKLELYCGTVPRLRPALALAQAFSWAAVVQVPDKRVSGLGDKRDRYTTC